ncbi:MAG TPA: arsinothricin resistance N-acetyltransferase ArsN1 family A [Nitrososphaerales archaeon]|nr:arsinothricin resistance N-acetyltransferase ArsN1 family A [Nitrososphaerales archaeon]
MDVETRRAGLSDSPAIAEIYNQGIESRQATFETEPRDESAIRRWLLEHDQRHPVLVAALGEAGEPGSSGPPVVGWASISVYRARSCYDGVGEFSVYVRDGYRGRGIGRALLLALIEEAGRLGYWKLVSRVFDSNLPSRALCKRCGFREVGTYEKHGRLDGRWLDTVIVERLIPENIV